MATYNYLDKNGLLYLWQKIKNEFATASSIPTNLSDLADDANHRLVTDTDKTNWNGKQDALVFNTAYDATNNKVATMSDVPTATSELDNDSGFLTAADSYKVANHSSNTLPLYYIFKSVPGSFPNVGSLTSLALSGYGQLYDDLQVSRDEFREFGVNQVHEYDSTTKSFETTYITGALGFSQDEVLVLAGSSLIEFSSMADFYDYYNSLDYNNTNSGATATTVQGAIDELFAAIASISGLEFVKVTELPTTGQAGKVYLVPAASSSTGNVYDEYIWVVADTAFEKIGSTSIDLSGYVQSSEMVAITNAEIDTILAS